MIVISLSSSPESLRGDLTKWFHEISVNTYVGRASARIREKLWERIVESIGDGNAVMIYTVNNEQGFDYRLIGTDWEVMDFDGLKLMGRPNNKLKEKT